MPEGRWRGVALACGLGAAAAAAEALVAWVWPGAAGDASATRPVLVGLLAACAAWMGMVIHGRRSAAAAGARLGAPLGAPRDGQSAGRVDELLRQVVPVWQRTADAVRATAEREAEALTERFANVSAHLDVALAATASAPQMDARAIDALMERHGPEIDRLRTDARAAIDAANAATDAVHQVGDSVQVLAGLARELQGIARATHMLGLNASVEATRAGPGGGAFAVVAHDIRELAAQSRQAALQMTKEIDAAQQRLSALRRQHGGEQFDDEDLALRTEINARAALRAIVDSLGEVVRGSRTMQDAGRQARADVDDILMSLQGHDRINQMLQSVVADLERMSAWLNGQADPAAQSPADWLERLENSYTMEDMRSTHHGTKQVQAQSAVEFF